MHHVLKLPKFFAIHPLTEVCQTISQRKQTLECQGHAVHTSAENSFSCQGQVKLVLQPNSSSVGHKGQFSRNPPLVFSVECHYYSNAKDTHSMTSFSQHVLCWMQCCSPSEMPWKIILERLLWCVACLNHESFHLLTVLVPEKVKGADLAFHLVGWCDGVDTRF